MLVTEALQSGGAIYRTADGFRLLLRVHPDLRGERACYIVLDNVSPLDTERVVEVLNLANPEGWEELNEESARNFFNIRQDGNNDDFTPTT
jgi:hypothetical protein